MVNYLEHITDSRINKDVESKTQAGLRGEKQPPFEAEYWHKDGTKRLLSATEIPVFDSNGNVTGMEGIVQDITERKRFEEALRKNDVGQGSGLGIAVVHGIVKNHHCAIVVTSQPGKGTMFTSYFPISKAKSVKEDKSSSRIARGGGEKIIFVDDDKSIPT